MTQGFIEEVGIFLDDRRISKLEEHLHDNLDSVLASEMELLLAQSVKKGWF